jgi:hypothetical protein
MKYFVVQHFSNIGFSLAMILLLGSYANSGKRVT